MKLRQERTDVASMAEEINRKYPEGTTMPRAESEKLDRWLDRIGEIDAEIRDHIKRGEEAAAGVISDLSADTFRVNGRAVRAIRTVADVRQHYAKSAARSVQTPAFFSGSTPVDLGEFARGVLGLPCHEAIRASLATGVDADGGHLVPSVVMPRILEALVRASTLLQAGAGILPLEAGAKQFTVAGIDTLPQAGWREEGGTVPVSAPTFRAVIAKPKSLSVIVKMTRELLADAAQLGDALTTALAQAFAAEMDRVGLRGSGTDPEPRGTKGTTGVHAIANGTDGASLATGRYGKFHEAMQSILQANGPTPRAAIMSPRSQIVLGGQVDTTGQPLAVPPLLRELLMLSTSQIPDDQTVGGSNDCSDIYLGDFSRLFFAMRENLSIARLSELYAGTGEVGIVAHARVDVLVTYPKAMAVISGVRP